MIPTGVFQWLFIALSLLSIYVTETASKDVRVVCYYTNWSVYRPGTAKFSPQNINPYLCTHLIYAFGGFTKENTLKPFDKYQDIEKGGYAKFTGLKTYNKNLKTLLAIGGWNEASSRFSPMVANPERRKQLVKNSIKFLRQNHFDGLDLDWEYPAFREGGKPKDKENYAKLVQELREEFERESEKTGRTRLLLTMAVPAGIEYVNKGYDIPKLTKYLDWMNILSYDYHSAFEPAVNHHAPLYPLQEATEYDYDGDLNIDFTIQHYLELGADPSKLVVGIPTYGRSYTLFNPDANAIGDPADGPGEMGEATRENGYLAYYEICENVKSNDWTVVQPNENAMGPYAYKENQWVGYDDEKIARKKAEYVAKNNLGGIMFWAIDNDDFRGDCHGKPYPLIEAAKDALISSYGLSTIEESTVKPVKSKTQNRNRSRTTEKPETERTKSNVSPRNRHRNRNNKSKPRNNNVKNDETSTYSSLKVSTPAYTTPEPPATPDQGGAFKCEDEGFFPHPKDCKKYFWCLSGPGELGIVAHQFTCPAGLYFNKAADSCDYSQNVLCNKKLSKKTSTTTTTTTTTPKSITTRFTTARPTTTTEEETYEDEYEYDEEIEEKDAKLDSEEDPKVIKELLDLIKKAGGIENLEKQLHLNENKKEGGVTTPSTRTKSIVEKFLSSRNENSKPNQGRYSIVNRNSRGPQNEGLGQPEIPAKQTDKKPQYTNISRRRPTASSTTDKTQQVEESSDSKYTNIRRNKETVSTERNEDEEEIEKPTRPRYTSIRRNNNNKETISTERTLSERNKILGEDSKEEIKIPTTPQYASIRRQRPSTTSPTTSRYVSIRRSTTTVGNKQTEETTTLKNELPTTKKREEITTEEIVQTTVPEETTTPASIPVSISTTSPIIPVSESIQEIENPIVFEPRPFATNPTTTTTQKPHRLIIRTTTTTKPNKVSFEGTTANFRRTRTRVPGKKPKQNNENSVEIIEKSEQRKTQRTRGNFKAINTTNKQRIERPSEENERNYRPRVLNDFSSLTSADFPQKTRRTRLRFSNNNKNDQIESNTNEITRRYDFSSTETAVPKQRTRKVLKRVTIPKRIFNEEPYEDNDNKDENIKLSESVIQNSKNAILNDLFGLNEGIRTRTVVRKIRPTNEPQSSTTNGGRTRKVIRRLRPSSTTEPNFENTDSPTSPRGKFKYLDIVRTTLPPIENDEEEDYTIVPTTEILTTNFDEITTISSLQTDTNTDIDDFETTTLPTTITTQKSRRTRPTLRKFTSEISTNFIEKTTEITPKPRRRFYNFIGRKTTESTQNEAVTSTPRTRLRFNQKIKESVTEATKTRLRFNENTEIDQQDMTVTPKTRLRFYQNRFKTTEKSRTTTTEQSLTTSAAGFEKQKSRNKVLYSKRKMNIPNFLQNSKAAVSKEEITTTEHPTTLYHVFAEPEPPKTTNITNKNSTNVTSHNNKIERVVEINRIVEVNEKETYDKIGAINRITSIKIVDNDGNLEDQINQRLSVVHDIINEERKNRPEIIDGISQLKIITPRPFYEHTTISLEGLFTTTKDEGFTTDANEVLDVEHSRFVNIRILKPDDDSNARSLSEEIRADTPIVARILNEKARVVEVTPENSNATIKIAPIQVAMARSIANKPVVGLTELNEQIGKMPFRSETERVV